MCSLEKLSQRRGAFLHQMFVPVGRQHRTKIFTGSPLAILLFVAGTTRVEGVGVEPDHGLEALAEQQLRAAARSCHEVGGRGFGRVGVPFRRRDGRRQTQIR